MCSSHDMNVDVNPVASEQCYLDALEVSLSRERFARYIRAACGDREKAWRLYAWNTAISAAFYGPLQGLEVAFRNAVHRELSRCYGDFWYDNVLSILDASAVERIQFCRASLIRHGTDVAPSRLVASLSFGFWVSLLGKGGRSVAGGKCNYDMTLWRPALFRVFSRGRRSRTEMRNALDGLRLLRNRVAHHEPVFDRNLDDDSDSILQITGWICPYTQAWVRHHSRVPELLADIRGSGAFLF